MPSDSPSVARVRAPIRHRSLNRMHRALMWGLLMLIVLSSQADAADRVPEIHKEDLPLAGTCAPLRKDNVTHVVVGRTDEWGRFKVNGIEGVLDTKQLAGILKTRAKSSKDHSVWIVASAIHRWGHVEQVRLLAQQAGVFRVGVRVRHERTGRALGFPLFLPRQGASDARGGLGAKLPVRLRTVIDESSDLTAAERKKRAATTSEKPSNLLLTYRAAQLAVKKANEEDLGPVIAICRFAQNCELRDAIQVMDMLYRGGCEGIRTVVGRLPASPKIQVFSILQVQDVPVSDAEFPGKVPPVEARDAPWPDHGANSPDAFSRVLQDLPAATKMTSATSAKRVRPELRKISDFARQKAAAELRAWTQELEAALGGALEGKPVLLKHTARASRTPTEFEKVIGPIKASFPRAKRLVPSTLGMDVFFSRQGKPVGRLQTTLMLAGGSPSFVNVKWAPPADGDERRILVDRVDPFLKGTAEALRTWLVGVFQQLRAPGGPKGLPMTSSAGALNYLPQAKHAAAAASLSRRAPVFDKVGQTLRALPYDRINIGLRYGGVTVVENDEVAGLVFFYWAVEGGELLIKRVRVQRTPAPTKGR